MTTSGIDDTQRKAAKVAGLAYIATFAVVVWANYAISERLIAGNAAQTAQNIIANERLFRINIACNVFYAAGTLVLLTALYTILRPVGRNLALLAALSRLVYALMWIALALNLFDVLRLLTGADYLQAFEADRLQGLARLRIRAASDAYYVGLVFYGMASTLCSYLWLKSRYIPRALAAFGLIVSAWAVICTFIYFVFPDFPKTVNLYWFDSGLGIFEVTLAFWLLFKGLSPSRPVESVPTIRDIAG